MIKPQWLELTISRTNFHGSKDVRAIEVQQYCLNSDSVQNYKYSRLSLSRIPRDSLKYFEISVVRHIRFAGLRKKEFD